MFKIKNLLVGLVAALGLVAGSAFAVAPDYSPISTAVDFSTVGTSIIAISALVAAVYVVAKGARMVIGAIKG